MVLIWLDTELYDSVTCKLCSKKINVENLIIHTKFHNELNFFIEKLYNSVTVMELKSILVGYKVCFVVNDNDISCSKIEISSDEICNGFKNPNSIYINYMLSLLCLNWFLELQKFSPKFEINKLIIMYKNTIPYEHKSINNNKVLLETVKRDIDLIFNYWFSDSSMIDEYKV